MSKSSVGALALAHAFLKEKIPQGGLCIDATAGRGGDTLFLCSLVSREGAIGKVVALDIQQEAVDSTRRLVEENGRGDTAQVFLDSHANLQNYAAPDSVDGIVFNFGWLPGGNHGIFTRPETSIPAIEAGLSLLKPGSGVMTLCIYYGRDCGFAERDALLEYLPTIDYRRFTVVTAQFANRPNNPPIPVFITRDE